MQLQDDDEATLEQEETQQLAEGVNASNGAQEGIVPL